MGRVIVLFFILSLSILAEEIGKFESNISTENGSTYFKNGIELKNILLEYDAGLNNDYKNLKIVLKNSHLKELTEKLYYTLNYEAEYNFDFTENDNDLLKLRSEFKLARYINDNFFINTFIEGLFYDYTTISNFENIYLKPKIQFRFPKSNIDINLNLGFRDFIYEDRNDYEFEMSANKEFLSRIYFEAGEYFLLTNNVRRNTMKLEFPDIYNENVNKLYGYLSYDILKKEKLIAKVYTKGENVFYFQGGDYENEIYTGIEIKKEMNGIVDLIDISGEYGYNYKEYTSSLSLKKYF